MFTKLNALAGLSLSLIASTASADGFYVSGSLISTTQEHGIERDIGTSDFGFPDASGSSFTSTTDLSGGIALGYDQHIGQSDFYWGVEAFYIAESGESRNINGALKTDIELDSSYGARILGGADVTDKFSVYAHLGVTQTDFDVSNAYTIGAPTTNASFDETAFSYGVGAEYAIDSQLSIFAEYTRVDGLDFDGIPEVAGGTGRVNPNSFDLGRTAIGVKFSF